MSIHLRLVVDNDPDDYARACREIDEFEEMMRTTTWSEWEQVGRLLEPVKPSE